MEIQMLVGADLEIGDTELEVLEPALGRLSKALDREDGQVAATAGKMLYVPTPRPGGDDVVGTNFNRLVIREREDVGRGDEYYSMDQIAGPAETGGSLFDLELAPVDGGQHADVTAGVCASGGLWDVTRFSGKPGDRRPDLCSDIPYAKRLQDLGVSVIFAADLPLRGPAVMLVEFALGHLSVALRSESEVTPISGGRALPLRAPYKDPYSDTTLRLTEAWLRIRRRRERIGRDPLDNEGSAFDLTIEREVDTRAIELSAAVNRSRGLWDVTALSEAERAV